MKKIMFNDKYGLTKAVLEGRKTQTRRLVQDEFFTLQWDVRDDTLVVENEWSDFIDIKNTKFCMFKVGEIVAITQSYNDIHEEVENETLEMLDLYCSKGWNNKMFVRAEVMPHQIRITNVRIERLQHISDDDCLAEGIIKIISDDGTPRYYVKDWKGDTLFATYTPQKAYAFLIDKVGNKGDWERNPYVFVYDFELIK